MKEEFNFENYLINMYQFYLKSNFDTFIEKNLNYNIRIGNYKKNIEYITNKILSEIKNKNKNILNFKEYYVVQSENIIKKIDNNIYIDIPVFEENFQKIALIIFNYLFKNKISYKLYLSKININSLMTIELYNFNDYKNFINYYINNKDIKGEIMSRVLPFLYQINYLGIYTNIKPYEFKPFFITNLYMYYYDVKDIKEISMVNFISFIKNKMNNEKNINKKRMFTYLFKYLKSLKEKNINNIFNSNCSMNIGSYDPYEYNLKIDKEKNIYFVNKVNNIEIKYGNEDYLNIAYSKYYENVIKRDNNDKYYYKFYNVFDDLLSSNYKNINNIFSLINEKMDIINKKLIIISSIYFANKKLNFSFKNCYKLLDYLLKCINDNNIQVPEKNKININNNNNSIQKNIKIPKEYLNKIVNLKNGTKISMREYLILNNVYTYIPFDSIIYLKNGAKISGYEFIMNFYKFVDKYDSYDNLHKSLINMIEFK